MQRDSNRAVEVGELDGALAKEGLGPVLLGVVVRAFGLFLLFQAVAGGVSLALLFLQGSRGSSSFSAGGFSTVGGSLPAEAAGYAFLAIFGLAVGGFFVLLMASRIVAKAYSVGTAGRR